MRSNQLVLPVSWSSCVYTVTRATGMTGRQRKKRKNHVLRSSCTLGFDRITYSVQQQKIAHGLTEKRKTLDKENRQFIYQKSTLTGI
jgi:hypothetical protein